LAKWYRASTLPADVVNEVYLNLDLVPVLTVVPSNITPGVWNIQCERDNDAFYYWLIGDFPTQAKAQAALETIIAPVDLTEIAS
jgi:hypothetical protein